MSDVTALQNAGTTVTPPGMAPPHGPPSQIRADRRLPVGPTGVLTPGWIGMIFLIITEGMLFAYLLFGYCYAAVENTGPWPPDGKLPFTYALPGTILLLASVGSMWWADSGIKAGAQSRALLGLLVTFVLGTGYVVLELLDWQNLPFKLSSHAFGSMYYATTGFDLAHVVTGLLIILALALWTGLGYFGARRSIVVSIGAAFWYFVVATWLAIFVAFYISPLLS